MELCEICNKVHTDTMVDLNTDNDYVPVFWYACDDCIDTLLGE